MLTLRINTNISVSPIRMFVHWLRGRYMYNMYKAFSYGFLQLGPTFTRPIPVKGVVF